MSDHLTAKHSEGRAPRLALTASIGFAREVAFARSVTPLRAMLIALLKGNDQRDDAGKGQMRFPLGEKFGGVHFV